MGCGASKAEKKSKPTSGMRQAGRAKQGSEAKIVMLGDAAVGKSSIAQRLTKDLYSEKYEVTIGGAFL